MALNTEEREQFLAEPHIAALAVDSGAEDRAPLAVPIWYQYAPGGDIWIMTGADSRKDKLITSAGRFSLLVERVTPTVRYVSVEGPGDGTDPRHTGPARRAGLPLSARRQGRRLRHHGDRRPRRAGRHPDAAPALGVVGPRRVLNRGDTAADRYDRAFR